MVTAVKSRTNHYETLGLAPSASADDIARAFAREIGLSGARAFGSVAQASIAHAVLSDPVKRRAYDEALGLNQAARSQVARPAKYSMTFPALHVDPPRRPEPKAERRAPEPIAEPRTAAFIASSLRGPANAKVRDDPTPARAPEPVAPPAEPNVQTGVASEPAFDRAAAEPESESRPIDWRRPAIAVGALVATVALVGAWAGWKAGNDIDASQAKPAVTVALPKAQPLAANIAANIASEPRPTATQPRRRTRAATAGRVAPAPVQHPLADLKLPGSSEPAVAEAGSVEPPAAAETPATTGEAPAAAEVAAPLSKTTIARTIGRIGYACGKVASTTAIEGAGSNVFKVTCTSGQSYRAAPVGGRYHFKRLGNH